MISQGFFKQTVISGGLLACLVLIWVGEVLAQSSLPLDVDLTPSEPDTELPLTESSQLADDTAEEATPEDPEDPSAPSTEETDAPAAPPLEVSPLAPPTPLRPNETPIQGTSDGTDAPAVADELPDLSEPPPEITEDAPAENIPAADIPVQELETFLVGQDAETAVSMLERDGWVVMAQTPRLIQLDRGQIGLDLNIDAMTGKVVEVVLIDLT